MIRKSNSRSAIPGGTADPGSCGFVPNCLYCPLSNCIYDTGSRIPAPGNHERRKLIQTLYKEGKNREEIAQTLHISVVAVSRLVKKKEIA